MNASTTSMQFLLDEARRYSRIPVAVVDAGEAHILKGTVEAEREGLIEPILVGQPERIHRVAGELGVDIDDWEIVEAHSDTGSSRRAVDLVLRKKVRAIAKGWIHTDTLMHAVLEKLRTERRVSHVFVAELPSYHKLLFITDAAINISPDLMTKAAIIENAVDLARMLGVEEPRVAALSAVEVVKPAIPSTIDAACLSVMAKRGQIKNAMVDGPLAFDNAISAEAARTKNIDSEVAGNVDVLLSPDIDAANILSKDLGYLAGAELAGIVVGARVPVILTSRSDSARARLLSAALAVLMHNQWDSKVSSEQTLR